MKMKKVTIEIPEDCDIIYKNGEVKLLTGIDKDKELIKNDIETAIDCLYDKWRDRIKGKFSVHCEFDFTTAKIEDYVNNDYHIINKYFCVKLKVPDFIGTNND